jgi:hypothetical protein
VSRHDGAGHAEHILQVIHSVDEVPPVDQALAATKDVKDAAEQRQFSFS